MRRIAAATFARSEYGTFVPILHALQNCGDFELSVLVSGTHLSKEFGLSVREIESDGFPIFDRIDMGVSDDSREAVAISLSQALGGFARSLARLRPDILLLVGDRYELLAPASAALALRIPVAHVGGGDVTEGAIDNQVRNAVTQMSHIHLAAMREHARRLVRMGEESWRVHVTGDPGLDMIRTAGDMSREDMESSLGIRLVPPVILVTYHPTTLSPTSAQEEITVFLQAIETFDATFIVTAPNSDSGNAIIREKLKVFASARRGSVFVENLGWHRFHNVMALADAMVGNSSSGLWEAPSLKLPVVNVGERQRGRRRTRNVIDAPIETDAIRAALRRVLDPEFKASLRNLRNPYGDGHASERIAEILRSVELGYRLLSKRAVSKNRDDRGPLK